MNNREENWRLAEQTLLLPNDLSDAKISQLLSILTSTHENDFADLYLQYVKHENWSLDEGEVKGGSFNIDNGMGLRSVCGEKSAFAYSQDFNFDALLNAASVVNAMGRRGQSASSGKRIGRSLISPLYASIDPIASITEVEKVALLERADRVARAVDPAVKEVDANLSSLHEVVMIIDSNGQQCADVRPLVRFNVSVIVEKNGRRERGAAGGGGRFGLDNFDHDRIDQYAKEAVRQALVAVTAEDAPAGTMPVVLGPGWPGILLHEAVGHGLEGDFNRKGTSAFSGKIGQKVASSQCTVIDDGTLKDRRGSLSVDDEGHPTEATVLIENGVLKEYMQDRQNAMLMGTKATGNGRRESFAHLPMPRMTNTYMLAGKYQPEEVIESVKKGLYAVNFSGGQVDITSGKFVFSSSEAYLIEDGKIGRPVKGATLIGNGPEAMHTVSMVANDMQLDTGVGVCGKEGQSVPVGVGQPTLKMDAITVGGVSL